MLDGWRRLCLTPPVLRSGSVALTSAAFALLLFPAAALALSLRLSSALWLLRLAFRFLRSAALAVSILVVSALWLLLSAAMAFSRVLQDSMPDARSDSLSESLTHAGFVEGALPISPVPGLAFWSLVSCKLTAALAALCCHFRAEVASARSVA